MASNNIQLPPFRNIDDFVLASARFGMPEYENKERWNNRILQNLLYYQTNYMVVALSAFSLVTYIRPIETLLGGALVSALLLVFFYISQNRGNVQRFKKDHPILIMLAIISCCTLVMYTMGSIVVFTFSVALPMLLILLHASFRMRNLRNKVQNKVEAVGLKRTPMGVLLKSFDQDVHISF